MIFYSTNSPPHTHTHTQLMALAEKNELFQLELQECSNQLSCVTVLINTLLRWAGLSGSIKYCREF